MVLIESTREEFYIILMMSSEEGIIKSTSQSDGSNTDDNVNNGRFTQETEEIVVSEPEEESNASMFQFFSCNPFENSLFDPLTNKTFMFLTLLYLMISNSLTEIAFDRFLKTLLVCKM